MGPSFAELAFTTFAKEQQKLHEAGISTNASRNERVENANDLGDCLGPEIQAEALDWNCQQHITARHTAAELVKFLEPMGR
jgi:hypothetical protein